MGPSNSVQITSRGYVNAKLTKPIIHFETVQKDCNMIGTGFFSNAYLYPQKEVVLKIIRKPYLEPLLNEIKILDHIRPIWPDLCQFQVVHNGKLVGLSVKYFPGVKIDEILQDQSNIYHQNPESRVRLVKRLKKLISQIQDLCVCHGDIYLDNIMIKQPDRTRQDCEIMIIDFGNGFIFDDKTRTNSGLMGWKFMIPPESRTGKKYDPKGVNAFMFGRVALQVLLLTPLADYEKGKVLFDPTDELNRLSLMGFDPSIAEVISACLSDNIQTRIKMLKQDSKMVENCKKYEQQ